MFSNLQAPTIENLLVNCISNGSIVASALCSINDQVQISGNILIPEMFTAHPTTLCFVSPIGSDGSLFLMQNASVSAAGTNSKKI